MQGTRTWPKTLGFWTIAVLAVLVSLISFRFLSFNPVVLTEALRANLLDHPIPFYVHTTLAPLALLLGIWQFLPKSRRSPYHRWAGRAYVLSCLVSAVAGFFVAFTTAMGMAAGWGFVILAVLWFGATLMGYLKGRARDLVAHRRWMMRSFALTCAAITLRLILAIGDASGFDFQPTYIFAAWACWIINLSIIELLIRRIDARPIPAQAIASA